MPKLNNLSRRSSSNQHRMSGTNNHTLGEFSMFGHQFGDPSQLQPLPHHNHHHQSVSQQSSQFQSSLQHTSTNNNNHMVQQMSNNASTGGGGGNYFDNLASHQHQIQKEQMDLDRRRKELELLEMRQQELEIQRQQLELLQQQQQQRQQFGASSRMQAPIPSPQQQQQPPQAASGASPQWWVCQVCSTKAFTSYEEATEHEGLCGGGQNQTTPLNMQAGFCQAVSPAMPQQSHLSQQESQFQQQLHQFEISNNNNSRPSQVASHHQQMAALGPRTFPGMPADLPMLSDTKKMNQFKYIEQQMPLQQQVIEQGPFVSPKPRALAMQTDEDWLTPLHCFVRSHCVEIFCATEQDVLNAAKGKRNPTQVGQVGIRCPHCHCNKSDTHQSERASVYYPTTISFIYTATMNLLQRHSQNCSAVPNEIMQRYKVLKSDDARSGTSKKYWVQSALSLGLVDTPNGIRFSARRPPPLPRLQRQQPAPKLLMDAYPRSRDDDPHRVNKLGKGTNDDLMQGGPLVTQDEKPYATAFSFLLLSQMQPCVFTEADRIGKRKGLPSGYPGLACSHCFGGFGSGRFFPSSLKTLSDTSKTLNVLHNHMVKCRKCPQEVKDQLEKYRSNHDIERAKMRFGSQKAFFGKIWDRLHHQDQGFVVCSGSKRKVETTYVPPPQKLYSTSSLGIDVVPTKGMLDFVDGSPDPSKRQRLCL